MKTQLYNILDTSARNWWYFRLLRKRGQVQEARWREREAILEDVRILRAALDNGGFLINSWGGWALHYDGRKQLHNSFPGLDAAMTQACLLLGIPIIDLTTIPEDRIKDIFKLPMPDILYDPEPEEGYHACQHAPFEYVAPRYVALGATTYNIDEEN